MNPWGRKPLHTSLYSRRDGSLTVLGRENPTSDGFVRPSFALLNRYGRGGTGACSGLTAKGRCEPLRCGFLNSPISRSEGMMRLVLIAAFAAILSGCARSADIMPLDDAARTIGVPKVDMELYGTGYGPVTVTMPDGEILTGHYQLAIGGTVSSGFATATGPGGSAFASGAATTVPINNPFILQATGNRGTSISCQGSAGGLGHGNTVCVTNRGAHYQLVF